MPGPWVEQWSRTTRTAFPRGYETAGRQAACSPRSQEALTLLSDVHMLEKAVYELSYELNNRDDSIGLPLTDPLQSVETWCHYMDELTR